MELVSFHVRNNRSIDLAYLEQKRNKSMGETIKLQGGISKLGTNVI